MAVRVLGFGFLFFWGFWFFGFWVFCFWVFGFQFWGLVTDTTLPPPIAHWQKLHKLPHWVSGTHPSTSWCTPVNFGVRKRQLWISSTFEETTMAFVNLGKDLQERGLDGEVEGLPPLWI